MAHKKAGGSSRNGRDSAGRRLGVKKFGGDIRERVFIDGKVIPLFGQIDVFIFQKRRPKWLPKGVTMKSFRELLISLYPKFSDWEK